MIGDDKALNVGVAAHITAASRTKTSSYFAFQQ